MFSNLCTPAKIYFILALIACIFALFKGVKIMFIAFKLIFAIIWTLILGWLCKKGFSNVSWFLLLLPYIIIALAMFGLIRMGKEGMITNKKKSL